MKLDICGWLRRRRAEAIAVGALVALAPAAQRAAAESPPRREPVRIGMDALHQSGGVPPGWQLSAGDGDPERGRAAFADLGCHMCHAVRGAALPPLLPGTEAPGPDLTGMGAHHPAGYFVESILDPNAVIVDGPGYTEKDGSSRMPAYPSMSLQQLGDLVAYLMSLTDDSGARDDGAVPVIGTLPAKEVPPPPPKRAGAFLAQSYDVNEGQLDAFEKWFAAEGAARLVGIGGLVSIDTFVDRTRPGPSVTTVFGFEDEAALRQFATHGALRAAKLAFDEFVGGHGHTAFSSPPVYQALSLSAPSAPAAPECAPRCASCHSETLAECGLRYHRLGGGFGPQGGISP